MSEIDPTALIVLSEIVLIETTLLLVVFVASVLSKRKKSSLLSKMLSDAAASQEERKSTLQSIFSKSTLSDDEKAKHVDAILNQEMDFYRFLSGMIHNKKTSAISDLSNMVRDLVKPYENLVNVAVSPTQVSQQKTSSAKQAAEDALEDLLSGEDDIQMGNEVDPSLDLSNTSDVEDIPEELLQDEEDQYKKQADKDNKNKK